MIRWWSCAAGWLTPVDQRPRVCLGLYAIQFYCNLFILYNANHNTIYILHNSSVNSFKWQSLSIIHWLVKIYVLHTVLKTSNLPPGKSQVIASTNKYYILNWLRNIISFIEIMTYWNRSDINKAVGFWTSQRHFRGSPGRYFLELNAQINSIEKDRIN